MARSGLRQPIAHGLSRLTENSASTAARSLMPAHKKLTDVEDILRHQLQRRNTVKPLCHWHGLIMTAARVTRLTWHKNTKTGLWHQTNETSLYTCQNGLTATAAGAAIGRHWGIENRSHFARCPTFALNVLRANGTIHVALELYINALNPNNALSCTMT